jgi:hypothetical protein
MSARHSGNVSSYIYYAVFPEKVDNGRAAEGFKWIIDRITDGNGVATPRDALSVIDAARSFQVEQFEREALNLPGAQLFSEDPSLGSEGREG